MLQKWLMASKSEFSRSVRYGSVLGLAPFFSFNE